MEGAAFCPFCGTKIAAEPAADAPLYQADVKGLLKSGRLTVYRDRTEFATSSVQKAIYDYAALVAVKKGLDRIVFVTENGQSESCPVGMKAVHEAYLYIEQAVRPYLARREQQLRSQGVQYSLASSQGLTSGVLNISGEQAEFRSKSGQSEVLPFRDVKAAAAPMNALELTMTDGRVRSFSVDKERRDEILAFVQEAVRPYVEERKRALLARGIHCSSASSQGPDLGTLDIYGDRAEFTAQSGRQDAVRFQDVRTVRLCGEALELALTDGRVKSFPLEADVRKEALYFVEEAVAPYVQARTEGFDRCFGVDERIEVNESRGVFHIIRQGGAVISGEYPLDGVLRCEFTDSGDSGGVLGGVLSGGMALLNNAAKAAGAQAAAEEKVTCADVLLAFQTGEEERVRFGGFPLGAARSNKKYLRCREEAEALAEYLEGRCPECRCVIPTLPEPQAPAREAALTPAAPAATPAAAPAAPQPDQDQFGINRYIEGVSRFIDARPTPLSIAILGSWGSGESGVMGLLSSHLERRYGGNVVWFPAWQFFQSDPGDQLPLAVGNQLISLLTGAGGAAAKDRAVKVAKSLISITSGIITQGNIDGQNLSEALFSGSPDSLDKTARAFAALVQKRTSGENSRLFLFVDELDRLPPAKAAELLETMRNCFSCKGCVFIAAVDYDAVLRGAAERHGQDFSGEAGERFFENLFHISFRVPASGLNIEKYVGDKLDQAGIRPESQEELGLYADLIRNSVGSEPKSLDRLFDSFLLLKALAGEEIYASGDRRLMLFALLCIQAKFRGVYDFLVQNKDRVTPDLLLGLSAPEAEAGDRFPAFAGVFRRVINTDQAGGISQAECQAFAQVLEFSSFTSR